ncbi:TRAP transporter substrate-binding protein DctP [Rhodanobacter aciditrophus]|uniref:TRAP transporter substrate-binding protein DctP n=1 Tax=Rhodanobacter aciditrophus TaxID=1623218 RepID=A0ABW4AZV2_9GAMM
MSHWKKPLLQSSLWAALSVASVGAMGEDLIYSDHQPLGQMRTTFLKEVLFPAIEQESNGRLNIDDHWNGELAIAYEALPTLKEGKTVNISTIVPEYTAKELPLSQIFKSYPTGPSGQDQVTLFRDIFESVPEFEQEFRDNNLEPIFLSTGYPVGFFSTKPVNDINDIQGQKWRSASFWHLDYLREAGAEPVRTHWSPEIYDMLEDGRLDGIYVNIDSAYNLKLHEKAPYALVSKSMWLGHLYVVAMNKTAYDALEQIDKDAIKRAASRAYRQQGRNMDEEFDTMVSKLRAEGAEIRIMTDEEVDQWGRLTNYPAIQRRWAQEQLKAGVQNAEDVIYKVTRVKRAF